MLYRFEAYASLNERPRYVYIRIADITAVTTAGMRTRIYTRGGQYFEVIDTVDQVVDIVCGGGLG